MASVCNSVCPHDNSQMNDSIAFTLGIGMTLGYSASDMVLGSQGQGHKVQKGDQVAGVSYILYRVPSL